MSLSASFSNAPIKRKLMLSSLLSVGVAVLCISLILTVTSWIDRREQAVSDQVAFADVIGNNVASALLFNDSEAATLTLAALMANPNIVDALIYDNTGKLFARYSNPKHKPDLHHPRIDPDNHLFSAGMLLVAEPIRFKGEVQGSIYLEYSMQDLYADILHDIEMIFLVGLGAVLAASLMFKRMLKTIIAPIEELSSGMGKVSAEQDYAVRVAVHGKDEVGKLASTFNVMLEHIQKRDAELAQYREHLEEKIEERTASLAESEERFRNAFEYSAIGMVLADPGGCLLKVNRAFSQMLGYAEQELQGRNFRDITHPDDLRINLELHKQLLAGETDHFQMEKRYFHQDGHVVWVNISASLVRDEQDRPLQFIAQIEDITERKQIETRLAAQIEDLRRWREATSGREKRILSIKHEVNELLKQAGQSPRYPSAELRELRNAGCGLQNENTAPNSAIRNNILEE